MRGVVIPPGTVPPELIPDGIGTAWRRMRLAPGVRQPHCISTSAWAETAGNVVAISALEAAQLSDGSAGFVWHLMIAAPPVRPTRQEIRRTLRAFGIHVEGEEPPLWEGITRHYYLPAGAEEREARHARG